MSRFKGDINLVKKDKIGIDVKSFDDTIKEIGDKKKVEEKYKKILKKKKKDITISDTRVAIKMGMIYMSQKKYKEAEHIFAKFKKYFKESIE